MADIKFKPDASWTQILSTEMNSLATATAVVQATGTNAAYDNGSNDNFWGNFELDVTLAVAPSANQKIDLYVVPISQAGGTTYADGSTTFQQPDHYVGSFIPNTVSTAQKLTLNKVPLPPSKFIVILVNNSGQAFAASGNTLNVLGYHEQSI